MQRSFRVLFVCLSLAATAHAQQASSPASAPAKQQASLQATTPVQLQLADIWASRTYNASFFAGFQWHAGGQQYLESTDAGIKAFETATGKDLGILVPAADMTFNGKALAVQSSDITESGKHVIISTDVQRIYRNSSKAHMYVLERATKKVVQIDTALSTNFTLSPDGGYGAYAVSGNVWLLNLASGQRTQLTTDGLPGKVLNGVLDWVYEEEFQFAQAIYWSPDSKHLAFYRSDESRVPEYNLQYWRKSLYPEDYRYKYPKAGEPNSDVTIQLYSLASGKTIAAQTGPAGADQYIPRVKWTATSALLAIQRLNRLQNHWELLHCNPTTGVCQLVLEEKDVAYVEINDNLTYLPGNAGFVTSSERTGFRHLYLYKMDGKLERALTSGTWEVNSVYGTDVTKGTVFFSAHKLDAAHTEVYSASFKGGPPKLLTAGPGSHEAEFSPNFGYFIHTQSTANTPPVQTLCYANGKTLKVLEDNAALAKKLAEAALPKMEFSKLRVSDSLELETWMIKPANMQAGKKYPVFMHCYGGPGSQTVNDAWSGPNYFWFAMLAQQGYLVVSVDNRGVNGRGAAFKKATYGKLGRLESDDQAAAARALAKLDYVDASRIGIWGWSFGGYLTSLCLTRYPDIFKAGIAVAPVTNWRYYDSIYTERYLGLPKDNAAGYDDNSPAVLASKLKGHYLLVHGTGDDNVHFQNSVAMVNGLVAANIPFETAYYPDRHHGISGGKTRLHLYTKMTDWLKGNL